MGRLEKWLAKGVMISDGAWGTELQARGLPLGAIPDRWNLTHPEQVEAVARSYVAAGSEIILTNTFRANAIAMRSRSAAELDTINRAAVAISKQSAGKRVLVFASIGPAGKSLSSGEVSAKELTAAFGAQAESLAAGGADALLIETMTDPEEARLGVRAAKATGLPVIASFAFDSGKNKDLTAAGATPEAAAAAMEEAGADGVGANCGVGVDLSVGICRRLHAACGLPLWIKPNAGLPAVQGAAIRYGTTAESFASHFAALREAGASFIGGCCGSTPEFIRALVAARAAA